MTVETANILLEYANKINALNKKPAVTSKAGEITSLSAIRQSFCANYDKKTRAYMGKVIWFWATKTGPLDFGRTDPTREKAAPGFDGFAKSHRRSILRHSGEGRNPVFQ